MTHLRRSVTVLMAALLATGCAPLGGPSSALEGKIRETARGTFALSEADGIEGRAFLVICPYESVESIEDRLGIDWNVSDSSENEGVQTIAILNDSETVTTIELSRASVDFCSAGRWGLLPLDTRLAVAESLRVTVAP